MSLPKIPLSLKFILGFSAAGLLLFCYLGAERIFRGGCASNEPCTTLLSLPLSFYCLAVFAGLVFVVRLCVIHRLEEKEGTRVIIALALLGMFLSGYFILMEAPRFFIVAGKTSFSGFPASSLALALFMLIFTSAVLSIPREPQ